MYGGFVGIPSMDERYVIFCDGQYLTRRDSYGVNVWGPLSRARVYTCSGAKRAIKSLQNDPYNPVTDNIEMKEVTISLC